MLTFENLSYIWCTYDADSITIFYYVSKPWVESIAKTRNQWFKAQFWLSYGTSSLARAAIINHCYSPASHAARNSLHPQTPAAISDSEHLEVQVGPVLHNLEHVTCLPAFTWNSSD